MDLVTPKAPEEIFPLEVWGLILDHLRSPSDLINCNKVCKAWRKLLELKKTTFLMPKVFPILYKYLQIAEADENDEEKESTITTILKIRLVSHGWKESVDSHHQTHPALNDIGFDVLADTKHFDYLLPFPFVPYYFDGSQSRITKLESFLGKGFSPDSNPFITRYVIHDDCDDIERHLSRLQTAFKNMLEAFGSHIWTCDLCFKTQSSKGSIYKLINSYLTLMPNLRSLKLKFYGPNDNGRPRRSKQKEILELLLQNEPYPRLKHLKRLEMINIPYPLSVGILASNGHLNKLSFQNGGIDDDALVPDYIANVQLPSLKQLTFPWCKQDLLSFPKINWPINVLHLRVEVAKLKNVFQAVSSNFSNTLEHFVLAHYCNYNTIESNTELAQIRLELPKLKILQLSTEFELKTIDFLQGCPGLQEIQLAFKVPHINKEDDEDLSMDGDEEDNSGLSTDEEDNAGLSTDEEDNSGLSTDEEDNPGLSTDEEVNEVIQFKDCITSMNQSNIWRILNNLQSIKVKTNGMEGKYYRMNLFFIIWYHGKIRKFTRRQFEKLNADLLRHKVPK